jgi:hypothetical protein
MLRKLILVALFFSGGIQFSQAQFKYSWKEMILPKVAPLTLFDPYTPGLSLGLEFQPLDALGVQFEYNLPFAALSFFNFNEGKSNHQTTRFRGEIRYYTPEASDTRALYFAAEGFSTNERYQRQNNTLLRDGKLYNYNNSNIRRSIVGGALKAGYQFNINEFIMLDVFSGIGIRQVEIVHQTDVLFESALLYDPRWGGDQKEGKSLRLHIPLGIRMGFSLYPRW